MARRAFPRPKPHGQPQAALTSRAVRLLSLVRNYNRSRPCPNGWVPFVWVHLGQRAVRPAQGRSQNTQHQTRQKRRTTDAGPPDDSTAEDEHSDHNRTNFDPRQAPARAPFAFRGLSCQLRRTAHVRFVKARPARPTSTHLRSCRACQSPSGGSIVAQT